MRAVNESTNDSAPLPPPPLADERSVAAEINGLRMHWRQWGRPDAPPVLLLHGLRGFSATWRGLAAALGREYRLIALDQRGRGESEWDPGYNYYTDAYLADLEGWVDRLGLDRFVLLGHSMGGTAAYVYADRHPQRLKALIIEDIAPGSSTTSAGAARVVAEMAELPEHFGSWSEARRYWRMQRPTLSVAAVEQRVAESLREGADGRITWRYDATGIRRTRMSPDKDRIVDLWPVVLRLALPTLVIRGERSDFCSADVMASICARNSHVECVTVPNASHYVHDDAPELFARHVQTFVSRYV